MLAMLKVLKEPVRSQLSIVGCCPFQAALQGVFVSEVSGKIETNVRKLLEIFFGFFFEILNISLFFAF